MLEIINVQTEQELNEIRSLWRLFGRYLLECFPERKYLSEFEQYLKHFELEITEHLPGRFAPPNGCLILAKYQGNPAGCVGLMDLGNETCELRRLFVKPEYRKSGTGKALIKAAIEQAKKIGYKRIRLNTNARMTEAEQLYRSLGFKDIEPYKEFNVDEMVFLEFKLQGI